ncbi:MAG TPA: hypothetical protein VFX31_03880, partial [Ktedonobacterales bacterium]|nr:hypothetical protein [Ktedonobacterales bacterium]
CLAHAQFAHAGIEITRAVSLMSACRPLLCSITPVCPLSVSLPHALAPWPPRIHRGRRATLNDATNDPPIDNTRGPAEEGAAAGAAEEAGAR